MFDNTKKNIPHYLQLDAMDCGPTCLSMIAKYYGKNYSLQTLRERSFLTREGVLMLGISDAAESIGFHTSGVRITLKQLEEDVPLPCILHWNQNHFQHMQESRTYETEVVNIVAALLNAVAEWEKSYLLTAPAEGTVAFMQLWKRNQYVEAGETMFVIVPHDAALPVGKVLLPMEGIGKVRTGQRVIIRLPAFPEQEFGTIEGRVESISPVPDEQGRFVLEIALPQGLTTRYGKELPLVKTMTGTASIVTKEKKPAQQAAEFKIEKVYA